MTYPHPGSGQQPASSTRIWPAVAALVAMAVALGVVGALVLRSTMSDGNTARSSNVPETSPGTVQLEPVTYRSPEPFTQSVVNDDAVLTSFSVSGRSRPSGSSVVQGDASQLYASRQSRPVCDLVRLVRLLTADPAVASAWAEAAGVRPDAVASTVLSLAPVVLTRDTAVTNHVYGSAGARSYQAVLQAGTPVLIDERGTPRTQCSCGNPLLPPRQESDDRIEGEPWEDFDPDAVVEVQPSDEAIPEIETVDMDTNEPMPTRVGATVALDGLLVADDDGVHVIDGTNSATQVLEEPVEAVFDDGNGGLIYTLKRPGHATSPYNEGPPAAHEHAVIWHLPSGSTEAVELVGVDDPDSWNRLLGVGTVGRRTLVVYSPLRLEGDVIDVVVPTGPVVALDLVSGERSTLLEYGFGWETSTGSVSFGGDRLAMEVGYDIPDWLLFGPELEMIEHSCRLVEASEASIEERCPWQGALDEQGRLVYFASALSYGLDSEEIYTLDLVSGEVVDTHRSAVAREGSESVTSPVQVRGNRMAVAWVSTHGLSVRAGGSVDLDSGAVVDLSGSGLDNIRSAHILEAPLLRPASTELTETQADPQSDVADIDPMNMLLPGGTCATAPGTPADAPLQLADGAGSRGTDPMTEDVLNVAIDPTGVAYLDVNGDGQDELIIAVMCNWGGSGYSTNIAAITVGPDGNPMLADEPLAHYGRGGRAVTTLATDDSEPGILIVSGDEWVYEDAFCCPSLEFTARWRVDDGTWVEVDP